MPTNRISSPSRLIGFVMILFCLWGVPAVQSAQHIPVAIREIDVEDARKKLTSEQGQNVWFVYSYADEIKAFNATVEEEQAGKKSPYLARAVLLDLDPKELVARIKAGAGVNVEDPVFGTPLHAAISQGRPAVTFQTLLKKGADPNQGNIISLLKTTPLVHAIDKNNLEALQLLLKAGADPNRADARKIKPLLLAIWNYKKELVEALLVGGANPNVTTYEGTPALIDAVKMRNNDSIIQALLSAGAKANVTDRSGKTALELALEQSCSMETAAVLLEKGASGETATTESGISLLHWAVDYNNARLLRAAIKAGAPLNSGDSLNRTPLRVARIMGRTELINILVEAGAD